MTSQLFSIAPSQSYAQISPAGILNLPAPGLMVTQTPAFAPAMLKGIKIFPDEPLKFDFILDQGQSDLKGAEFEKEASKLIKYFLASLTVPDDELWVNLSPAEKDRITTESFGVTEMGRDLLAQDYILKQLTASLMYPEDELGAKFWKQVRQKVREVYGADVEIPVDTFNKVWIVPQRAEVYESNNTAFITDSYLKVMLEEDYLVTREASFVKREAKKTIDDSRGSIDEVIREIIIPEIEKEVNEGENFAQLRQIYSSFILAAWFKRTLRESFLGQIYVDQNKVGGVDVEDKQVKQKIYDQYLEAFKKGVYDYIKEDVDPATQEMIPRRYFSGGVQLSENFGAHADGALAVKKAKPPVSKVEKAINGPISSVEINLKSFSADAQAQPQMTDQQDVARDDMPVSESGMEAEDSSGDKAMIVSVERATEIIAELVVAYGFGSAVKAALRSYLTGKLKEKEAKAVIKNDPIFINGGSPKYGLDGIILNAANKMAKTRDLAMLVTDEGLKTPFGVISGDAIKVSENPSTVAGSPEKYIKINRRQFLKSIGAAVAGIMLFGITDDVIASSDRISPEITKRGRELSYSYLEDVLEGNLLIDVSNSFPRWQQVFTINKDDHEDVKKAKQKYQDLIKVSGGRIANVDLLTVFFRELFEKFGEAEKITGSSAINSTDNILLIVLQQTKDERKRVELFHKHSLSYYTSTLVRARRTDKFKVYQKELHENLKVVSKYVSSEYEKLLNDFIIKGNELIDFGKDAGFETRSAAYQEVQKRFNAYLEKYGLYVHVSFNVNLGDSENHFYIKTYKRDGYLDSRVDDQTVNVVKLSGLDDGIVVTTTQGHDSEIEQDPILFVDSIALTAERLYKRVNGGDFSNIFGEAYDQLPTLRKDIIKVREQLAKLVREDFKDKSESSIKATLMAMTARHEARHFADSKKFNKMDHAEKEARAFAEELKSGFVQKYVMYDWVVFLYQGHVYDLAARKVFEGIVAIAQKEMTEKQLPEELKKLKKGFLNDFNFEAIGNMLTGLAKLSEMKEGGISKLSLFAGQWLKNNSEEAELRDKASHGVSDKAMISKSNGAVSLQEKWKSLQQELNKLSLIQMKHVMSFEGYSKLAKRIDERENHWDGYTPSDTFQMGAEGQVNAIQNIFKSDDARLIVVERDFRGAHVAFFGPGRTAEEILSFLRTYPEVGSISIFDADSYDFINTEKRLKEYAADRLADDPNFKLPEINGYMLDLLGEYPEGVTGKFDFVFESNVVDVDGFYTDDQAVKIAQLIEKILKPGGVLYSPGFASSWIDKVKDAVDMKVGIIEVDHQQVSVDGNFVRMAIKRAENSVDQAMMTKPLSQRLDPQEYKRRVEQYLKKHDLLQYIHIRELFTPQIMDVLLEQPVLKPVFMVHLTEEAGEVGPLQDVDEETVAKIGGIDILNKFTSFKIGDASAANEAAARGQELMIGVTDRISTSGGVWSGAEMANQRQTFFPLDDGTWLGVKGSGDNRDENQSVRSNEEEFIFLRGLATRGEVNDFIQSRKEVLNANPGKVRTVKFLGYRRINKLFRDNGRPISADQLAQRHPKRPHVDWDYSPILIFNHVASPYRLSKFLQLAEHDEHLTHLLHHVQNAYTAMGEQPPISVQQMFDQTLKGMALNQAGKQNLLLWKKTYHIQDVDFFWGEEADHEEWKTYQQIFTWLIENEQYAFPPLDLRFFMKYKIKLAEIRAVLQAAQWVVNSYRRIGKLEEFISSPRQLLKMVFQTYFHHLDDQYLIPWLIESDQLEVDGKRYVVSKVLQKFFAKDLWSGLNESYTGDADRDAVAVMLDVQGWLNQEAASRGLTIENVDALEVIQISDIKREETLTPERDRIKLAQVNDDRVVRRALDIFNKKGIEVIAKGNSESVVDGYVELILQTPSLALENHQIADDLGKASKGEQSVSVQHRESTISIRYKVNRETPMDEVKQWFTALAYLFDSQKGGVSTQIRGKAVKREGYVMAAAPAGFIRVNKSSSHFRSPAGFEVVGFQADGNSFSGKLPDGEIIVFQSVKEKSDGLTGDIVGHRALSGRLLGNPDKAIHASSLRRIEFVPETAALSVTHDRDGDGNFVTELFLSDGSVQQQKDSAMMSKLVMGALNKNFGMIFHLLDQDQINSAVDAIIESLRRDSRKNDDEIAAIEDLREWVSVDIKATRVIFKNGFGVKIYEADRIGAGAGLLSNEEVGVGAQQYSRVMRVIRGQEPVLMGILFPTTESGIPVGMAEANIDVLEEDFLPKAAEVVHAFSDLGISFGDNPQQVRADIIITTLGLYKNIIDSPLEGLDAIINVVRSLNRGEAIYEDDQERIDLEYLRANPQDVKAAFQSAVYNIANKIKSQMDDVRQIAESDVNSLADLNEFIGPVTDDSLAVLAGSLKRKGVTRREWDSLSSAFTWMNGQGIYDQIYSARVDAWFDAEGLEKDGDFRAAILALYYDLIGRARKFEVASKARGIVREYFPMGEPEARTFDDRQTINNWISGFINSYRAGSVASYIADIGKYQEATEKEIQSKEFLQDRMTRFIETVRKKDFDQMVSLLREMAGATYYRQNHVGGVIEIPKRAADDVLGILEERTSKLLGLNRALPTADDIDWDGLYETVFKETVNLQKRKQEVPEDKLIRILLGVPFDREGQRKEPDEAPLEQLKVELTSSFQGQMPNGEQTVADVLISLTDEEVVQFLNKIELIVKENVQFGGLGGSDASKRDRLFRNGATIKEAAVLSVILSKDYPNRSSYRSSWEIQESVNLVKQYLTGRLTQDEVGEYLETFDVQKNIASGVGSTIDKDMLKRLRAEEERIRDQAMLSEGDHVKGGIDFNPANLDLHIKRDGNGMPMMLSPVELDNIHIDGLIPVIINISPVTDLPMLLGATEDEKEFELSSAQ